MERPKTPFAVTNGSFLLIGGSKRAAEVAYLLSKDAPQEEQVGVEWYPTQESLPFLGRSAGISAGKIRTWEQEFGPVSQRVHIEFAYDEKELRFQTTSESTQHAGKGPLSVPMHKWLYQGIRDAKSGFGLRLADELGISKNVHINVALGFAFEGKLGQLLAGGSCLLENTILYNIDRVHPEIPVGPDLYDPRVIARELIEGPDGNNEFKLLFARDHLIDYFQTQHVDPMEAASDPVVQRYTDAVHMTGPEHTTVPIGDPNVAKFVLMLERSPHVTKPVQYVFDYSPTVMLFGARSLEKQVDIYKRTIAWFRELQEAA